MNLNHHKILITRPENQAKSLCDHILALGGKPILFPTIEIVDIENHQKLSQQMDHLDQMNIAIFVSPNAVEKCLQWIRNKWPKNVKVGAIGKSTADSLKHNKINVDFFPKENFNSEALLALPELKSVSNQKIIIFCGEDGRTLLSTTLQERGAEVIEAYVYQRKLPQMQNKLLTETPDIIVCTSHTSLGNLSILLGDKARLWQQNMPLLVSSERLMTFAKQQGWVHLLQAPNATDEAIIAFLLNIFK